MTINTSASTSIPASQANDRRALLQSSLQALEAMEAKLASVERAKTEPIAIIGMSCRFPGANNVDEFWQLLREGRDTVRDLPPERRRITDSLGAPAPGENGRPMWRGGFLNGLDMFDPQFFGITPREALTMDPQHRMALEVSWEALERAGLAAEQLQNSLSGVFLGISTNDYGNIVRRQGYDNMDAYAATGGSMNVAAGRISFTLGLQGPCIAVDTACSSSLVAIHLAVQSLRGRDCNMALAGGVNAVILPDGFISFGNWGMMASDGRCKTFDSRADGFVRSEGCGILVLKRLSDAMADGDTVLAVIRGSAVNQDGRTSGLTVPSGLAQRAMLRAALNNAGVAPAQMQYIEAHGTGTALGDPIEVEAIGAVLGQGRTNEQPLFLSSVKTNIGHPESAAGIAGVIKVVLAMQHGEIPPHLHLQQRSPAIPWPSFPINIPTEPTPWPMRDGQRLAGVSGFGFSGTNAHVILGSAPASATNTAAAADTTPSQTLTAPRHVLTLSAKTEAALREMAGHLGHYLTAHPELDPADVCFTLNTGRNQFAYRLAVTGASTQQLAEQLTTATNGESGPGIVFGRVQAGVRPRVAFLFTGQGAQYAGMGKHLYETQPAFRAALDQCMALLAPHIDRPLLDVIFKPDSAEWLNQTQYTQPALFALEYALAMLWRAWGITPAAVLGHSVGEYVGAVIAEVMRLEDAAALIAARGRLMQSLPAGGAMSAIFAPADQVKAAIAPYPNTVTIAAVNGPEHTVISGVASDVDAAVEQFAANGVRVQRLTVSHAFHSPLMDPILDEFERRVAAVELHVPRLPLISNLTGAVIGDEITKPSYWRQHLREAVQFNAGIETLRGLGIDMLIEAGPHPTLLGMAQHALSAAGESTIGLPSLRRNRDDWQVLLDSVATLAVRGATVDWKGMNGGARRTKLALPTYAFQRSRYWVDLPMPGLHNSGAPAGAHPLLGRMTQSPLLKQTLFETYLSANSPTYLADHVVYGNVVFPGTAYLEMALAAAQNTDESFEVASLSIREPLMLQEDAATKLQLVLTPGTDGDTALQIISFDPDATDRWHTHATGSLRPAGTDLAAPQRADLAALKAGSAEAIDTDEYYRDLAAIGLSYGPAFHGLTQLHRGTGEAIGFIQLPERAGKAEGYQIHPALLDACFHVIGAALPNEQRDDPDAPVYVPVGMSGVHLYQPSLTAMWCHVQLASDAKPGAPALNCRVQLLDEAGDVIAVIERLDLMQAPRNSWGGSKIESWFHQIAWRAQPRTSETPSIETGAWLIVGDQLETSAALAERLRSRGQHCTIAIPGPTTAQQPDGSWQFNADDAKFVSTLRAAADASPIRGVVGLWTSVMEPASLEALWADQHAACSTALHLSQGLAELGGAAPRLWLVTSGAQPVEGDGTPVVPGRAALWGMGRVIAREAPALHCTCIDLEANASDDALTALVDALLTPDAEDQIALRGSTRYVARLTENALAPAIASGQPYQLTLPERGALDKMTLLPLEVREPEPGHIAIAVHATGLNFRDVLNVLGMYPGDPGPPGLECAGVVLAVGEGVSEFKVGDAVIALAPRAFDAVAYTRTNMAVFKPDNLSFADAVTAPSAFLTAYHGLHNLAKLQPGERVLIHAAAGGVGVAAVQLAQQAGAEVFATAGSPAKHAFLRAMGVRHIFSSREADFLPQVMALTNGHGIDVVLNSLSEQFISDSFAALAPNGRFLEIGKRGIWTMEQAATARPDVMYAPFDLGDVLRDEPHVIHAMLSDVMTSMSRGELKPLPLRAFPVEQIVDAFRFMAQAKHIGKVVITHRPSSWHGSVRADGSYLVTGGLGGLGLRVAQWLVDRGARHVALMGRNAPSAEAAAKIDALREAGAEVQVVAADVAKAVDVTRALAEIAQPLRGVIHAAGVLDDGILAQQTWARFERVLTPKVAGVWNLHTATHGQPLDFFVMFSSVSGLLGNPGQVNYAAANNYLDGLAHQRRAMGLPAQSIDWGAWAEVGMAAKLDTAQQGRTAGKGIKSMTPDEGVQALERALIAANPQLSVLPVRWSTLLRQFPAGARPALLAELDRGEVRAERNTTAADDVPAFRKRFGAAEAAERSGILIARISQHLARVMGLGPSEPPDATRPLNELGLDSLMAVELKNRIDADLLTSLQVSRLMQGTTIVELAEQLAVETAETTTPIVVAVVAESSNEPSDAPEELLAKLDQLSDQDVDSLLDEMLKETKGV